MPVMLFRGIDRHNGTFNDCNKSGVGTLQRPVEASIGKTTKKKTKKTTDWLMRDVNNYG